MLVATRRKNPVLRQLCTLFNVGAIGDMTDGQLLERFATGGEAAELAFAALVERHGPVVLHACRSILRDEHEAEDAFQATFLVLVRKARLALGARLVGPLAASGGLPRRLVCPVRRHPTNGPRAEGGRPDLGAGRRPERLMTSRGSTSLRRFTRRSSGCRSASASRSCCATSKVAPTSRRHGTWAARSARSRADWPGAGGG